jgi:arabinan endo-1,5-alpha-L-arabinosidase
LVCLLPLAPAAASKPLLLELTGDLAVHDPAIIKEQGTYYLFATGGRRNRGVVSEFTSPDMRHWTQAGKVLPTLPAWVADEVPKARNAWAPDVSFFNDKFHLYYSLSSFGVNHSAIALATNKTLDPSSPDFKWVDEGLVVRSRQGEDDFNAIDPNVVVEPEDRVWLSWGSFWGGIKLRQLDPATGKPSIDPCAANGPVRGLALRL